MRGWIWLVAAGCVSDITLKNTTDLDSTPSGDPQTETPPPTTIVETDYEVTTATTFDCWSELVVDDGIDGTVDLREYEGFDPAHIDRGLYLEDDFGDDGVLDAWLRRSFDVDGHVVHRLYDTGTTTDAVYNTDGNLVWEEEDSDGDGMADFRTTWTWNVDLPLLEERDDGADGTVDWWQAWAYDGDGRLTLYQVDDNGEGDVTSEDVMTYDAIGRLAEVRTTYHPHDPQQRWIGVFTWIYTDPVLQIGTIESDWDDDGSVDQLNTFENDAAGRTIYYASDWENDGVVDQELWVTYDADGHQLSVTENDYTFPEVGPMETRVYVQTGVWDALGRQIEYRSDAPEDTGATTLMTWTFGGTCPS